MRFCLNPAQRSAVSWFFNTNNRDGEKWEWDEPVQFYVSPDGQLQINGNWLHTNGEWATHPQPEYAAAFDESLVPGPDIEGSVSIDMRVTLEDFVSVRSDSMSEEETLEHVARERVIGKLEDLGPNVQVHIERARVLDSRAV